MVFIYVYLKGEGIWKSLHYFTTIGSHQEECPTATYQTWKEHILSNITDS